MPLDSNQTDIFNQIVSSIKFSDVISIVAVIISICALILSWLSIKRTERIEKPSIESYSPLAEEHIFCLRDYSGRKNLNINKMKIKLPNKLLYRKIPYYSKLRDEMPPLLEVRVSRRFALNSNIFKIYTNYNTIKFNSNKHFINIKKKFRV